MRKSHAFVVASVATVLVAFAVVACSDDAASKFPDGQEDSGSPDTGPGFISPDSGSDGNAAVSCNPSSAAFTPAWKAPTQSASCSAQQMSTYYDACLTTQAPDAGDTCKAFTGEAANTACAACLEPTDNSGPIQWHHDRYYYTLNVAGCLSILRSEPNDGQCPATYGASLDCQRAACDGCFSTPNATFPDFQACQASAKGGTACSSFESKISQVCGTTYNDPDGGAYGCFANNGETAKEHFVRVEGYFCGP